MKVLFITRWFPPCSGIFIRLHAHAVSLSNDLTVLAILPGEKSSGLRPEIEGISDQQKFIVIRYYYRQSHFRIGFIAKIINILRFIINAIAGYCYISKHQGSIDLIHVHILTRAAVIPFFIKIFTGTPYIISEHWTRYIPQNWGFKGKFRKLITRFIVRRASAVVTVSEFLMKAMQSCGLTNNNFFIIPNVVDTALFSVSDYKETGQKKRILHVSNFNEKSKNIKGILRVINILREQRKDFEIVLVGGREPALSKAKKYASEIGLGTDVVIFKGQIPPDELADAYRQSSFLLMFSNFESFSIVIPEAISCGRPVLATNAGGIPEYFDNRAGILTTPGNEEELLQNLNFMLDNSDSFDPVSISNHIEERFGLEAVGAQLSEVYKSVGRK